MFSLIIFAACTLLALVAIVYFFLKRKQRQESWFAFVPVMSVVIFIVGILLTSVFFQDPGEVIVIRNITGSLSGSTDNAGMHFKMPWQSTIKYDIRNNTISFIGKSEEDYTGGRAFGPQITINDSSGTTANMDVQIQYSLKPEAAIELYRRYGGTQENFVRQVIAVDSRAYSRTVAGKIDTIEILTGRGAFSAALKDALSEAWETDGVIVENVSVQDIRYSKLIKERYAEAQAAEIAKDKAKNEQEVAKVEAETKLIKAEGEANANRALQESLTEDILRIRWYETVKATGKNGNLIVIPDNATPLINTQPQK